MPGLQERKERRDSGFTSAVVYVTRGMVPSNMSCLGVLVLVCSPADDRSCPDCIFTSLVLSPALGCIRCSVFAEVTMSELQSCL